MHVKRQCAVLVVSLSFSSIANAQSERVIFEAGSARITCFDSSRTLVLRVVGTAVPARFDYSCRLEEPGVRRLLLPVFSLLPPAAVAVNVSLGFEDAKPVAIEMPILAMSVLSSTWRLVQAPSAGEGVEPGEIFVKSMFENSGIVTLSIRDAAPVIHWTFDTSGMTAPLSLFEGICDGVSPLPTGTLTHL